MDGGFNFISPSIQFNIRALTSVPEAIGSQTFLGVVGEFQKGPAFQPLEISNKDMAYAMLGRQSTEMMGGVPKYPSIFGVNQFLEESSNVTAVRVLGLSGYDAGTGWALTVRGGVDTANQTEVVAESEVALTVSGGIFQGATLPDQDGATLTIPAEFVDTGTEFTGTTYEVTVVDYYISAGTEQHDIIYDKIEITAPVLEEYDDLTVCIIRSRADYDGENLEFDAGSVTISGGTGTGLYDEFTIVASGATGSEQYNVSLNPQSRNYITKVIGETPTDKNSLIWVEKIYSATLTKLFEDELAYNVNPSTVKLDTADFKDYSEQYRSASTPWVVSELRGNKIYRLFRFFTISDGDASNRDVKISIQNINPATKEFDVVVRQYGDTDRDPTILESFTRCTLNESLPSYIGRRIGSVDPSTNEYTYERRSDYIYIILDDEHPQDAFPAGFEGYEIKAFDAANTGSSTAKPPRIFYKKAYSSTENRNRVYLGVSETAYGNTIGTTRTQTGINDDFFEYFGVETSDNVVKSKGFHMDADASGTTFIDGTVTIGEFEVGEASFKDNDDINDSSNIYSDRAARKFTLLPYRGFDGWDIWRRSRTNTDAYAEGATNYFPNNDWDAYNNALQEISNPEEVEMNLLVTPNLNWFDHGTLVSEAVDIVSRVRGDAFYVMDPPDIKSQALADELADLFDIANIDNYYAGTYGPWLEVFDSQNNRPIYMPPSVDMVRNFALTDNRAEPWFAVAGFNRGGLTASRTRGKTFTKSDRDTLYTNRVNPIMDFKSEGPTIYGNRTSQFVENALQDVNIVRLLLFARKGISTIANQLLFDPNDGVVRNEFETKANAFLSRIQRDRGLTDFKIVGDNQAPEVLDRKEMLYKLLLKPTRALEYIGISFVVTPTGASFDEVLQTL